MAIRATPKHPQDVAKAPPGRIAQASSRAYHTRRTHNPTGQYAQTNTYPNTRTPRLEQHYTPHPAGDGQTRACRPAALPIIESTRITPDPLIPWSPHCSAAAASRSRIVKAGRELGNTPPAPNMPSPSRKAQDPLPAAPVGCELLGAARRPYCPGWPGGAPGTRAPA